MVFSEKGYKEKWDSVKNQILINKKLLFAPINHVGIFYNGHFFNLTSSLTAEAPQEFRAVAFYNFKNGFLKVRELLGDITQAVNDINEIASNVRNQVNNVNNEFNRIGNLTGVEDVSKVLKDINF
jgi:methyl-accepting chemotaxis protein